jgi:hypothetical protein
VEDEMILPPAQRVPGGNVEITLPDGVTVTVADAVTSPLEIAPFDHPSFPDILKAWNELKTRGKTLADFVDDPVLRAEIEAIE